MAGSRSLRERPASTEREAIVTRMRRLETGQYVLVALALGTSVALAL
ncbi:hypothetical protein [Demequina aestuarii]|nr:hypothetical protein [Demequina aestuarii]